MILQFKTDLFNLTASLPHFLELADANRWKKRTLQLSHDAISSPFGSKVVADYHWLEFALSELIILYETNGSLNLGQLSLESITALFFAQTIVNVHQNLSVSGCRVLEGRIRDALKANTGFAPIYHEMAIARRLFDAGFEVEFSDMEGIARFDLRFWKGNASGEVECKSLSVDAGRKIHRRDFYRFMDSIGSLIRSRAVSGAREVILVTLKDRLPTEISSQYLLREAIEQLLAEPVPSQVEGDFFVISWLEYSLGLPNFNTSDFYDACRDAYGENCHASGVSTPDGICLVVMRSRKEDDCSKPLLEAMKKAATQFSELRPAFVAVQFDDIVPTDLLLPNLRRRIEILSGALFWRDDTSHIAATSFSTYRGLVFNDKGIGEPGVGFINPKPRHQIAPADYLPFLGHIPDDEFVHFLASQPSKETISNIFNSSMQSKDDTIGFGPLDTQETT